MWWMFLNEGFLLDCLEIFELNNLLDLLSLFCLEGDLFLMSLGAELSTLI
jgi:hypothetical protein